MKKYSIGIILILLLMFSVFISCSKDKPTENNQNPLVGSWDLTTIKADGVIVDPLNDTLNVYINAGIYTYKSNGTGSVVFTSGDTFNFSWSTKSDTLVINNTNSMRYIIQGNNLSTFQAGDGIAPDLEINYIRIF
ncbi:MAG: lipocalin family protein [Methanosarcinaceae archaeon]